MGWGNLRNLYKVNTICVISVVLEEQKNKFAWIFFSLSFSPPLPYTFSLPSSLYISPYLSFHPVRLYLSLRPPTFCLYLSLPLIQFPSPPFSSSSLYLLLPLFPLYLSDANILSPPPSHSLSRSIHLFISPSLPHSIH